ncbi:hypothetical protein BASA82_000565 [Batrachochytrium salamandrivorans]|nr:hypothetical protein BASA81_003636 [Batrachochytrium salamandrivorans]KAH9262380.1 hypothetical protein BASA82_000565 [Batrachochytrium salamandrivorans]
MFRVLLLAGRVGGGGGGLGLAGGTRRLASKPTSPPPRKLANITLHDPKSKLKFQELQELQLQLAQFHSQGKYDDAAECADYVIQQMRDHFGGQHVGLASALCSRGVIAKDLGNLKEAVDYYQQSIIAYQNTKEHYQGKAVALQNLGNAWREQAKLAGEDKPKLLARAYEVLWEASEMLRKGDGPTAQYAESLRKLGNLDKDRGNLESAEKLLTEAVELADLRVKADHPLRFSTRNDLAMVLKTAGKDFDRARQLYQSAIEYAQDKLGVKSRDFIVYTHNLAELLETNEHTKQEALELRHFLLKLR